MLSSLGWRNDERGPGVPSLVSLLPSPPCASLLSLPPLSPPLAFSPGWALSSLLLQEAIGLGGVGLGSLILGPLIASLSSLLVFNWLLLSGTTPPPNLLFSIMTHILNEIWLRACFACYQLKNGAVLGVRPNCYCNELLGAKKSARRTLAK